MAVSMTHSFPTFIVIVFGWLCAVMLVPHHVAAVRSLSLVDEEGESMHAPPSKEDLRTWRTTGAGRLLKRARPGNPSELFYVQQLYLKYPSTPRETVMFYESVVLALYMQRPDTNTSSVGVFARAPQPKYQLDVLHAKRVDTPKDQEFRPCPAEYLFNTQGTVAPSARGFLGWNPNAIVMEFDHEIELREIELDEKWRFKTAFMYGFHRANQTTTEFYKDAEPAIKLYLMTFQNLSSEGGVLGDMKGWAD